MAHTDSSESGRKINASKLVAELSSSGGSLTFLPVSLPSADMREFDTSTRGNVWPISETHFPRQVALISAAPADRARGSGAISAQLTPGASRRGKGKIIC